MTILAVDAEIVTAADLTGVALWLRSGGIVAFPTDTLYGLAVDCTSDESVAQLFALKGRASDAPIPLIAASVEQVRAFCGAWTGETERVARAFWPGPLSVIVDAPAAVAPAVAAGTGSVAIRVPAHAVARAVAAAVGAPITATSANRSGQTPAIRAEELRELARHPRVLVIDAGPAPGGPPSTIVDVRRAPPVLVREGAIAWNRVLESLQG